jgi:hypothetical protein
MKRVIYMHIGLPRTGTTALQRHVFPKFKTFRYLGKDAGLAFKGYKEDIQDVFEFIGALYYGSDAMLLPRFDSFDKFLKRKEQSKFGEQNEQIPLLISNEGFTIHILKPAKCDIYGAWTPDPLRAFKRLKAFGNEYNYDINVVFVHRNTKEWIHSIFAQEMYYYNFHFKINNINMFLEFLLERKKKGMIDTRYFSSDYMIRTLEDTIGADKVHSFAYENLFENNVVSKRFLQDIFSENQSIQLHSKVNQKLLTQNIRVGSTKPHWFEKDTLRTSIKKGIDAFRYSFSSVEDCNIKLIWNEQSDELFSKLQ